LITYTRYQRSDFDPLKTHTSFGSAHTPPRMLILTTSRAHNTSWLITPEFTQSIEGLHLLQSDLKSMQDENPIPFSLYQSNLSTLEKNKSVKN